MKPVKALLSLLIVLAVLFVSAFSVRAIGFRAEDIYESVFVIYSGNSLGSGFAVTSNCIVTNAHVISDARSVYVKTYGGDQYRATILGMDEDADIAVLIIEDTSFPYLPVADLSAMNIGDDIYAIGAPKSMDYTLTKGVVSAKARMVGRNSYIQIDAAINKGNSGGPLLNDNGEVLGMNTLKMTDSEGIGLAIPVDVICAYLADLGIVLDSTGGEGGQLPVPTEYHAPTEAPQLPVPTEYHTPTEVPNAPTQSQQWDEPEPDQNEISAVTWIAIAVAGGSLAGNLVLLTTVIRQRKKILSLQYTPKEEDDFDIDIWE